MEPFGSDSYGLLALVPLALASAFMPTRTFVAARLMLTRRPVANTLAFVAGNWVWRLALGTLLLLVLGLDLTWLARWGETVLRVLIGLGAVAFALLAIVQWRTGSGIDEARVQEWLDRLDGLEPGRIFVTTLSVMVWPGAQWLFVIAGTGLIHRSGVAPAAQFALLVAYTACQLAMVASPLLIARLGDAHTERIRRNALELRLLAQEHSVAVFAVLSVGCALLALSGLLGR